MASIFQIGISRNTKCALKDGFRKSSHILVVINGMRCTLLWLMPDSRCMGIENESGRALLVV